MRRGAPWPWRWAPTRYPCSAADLLPLAQPRRGIPVLLQCLLLPSCAFLCLPPQHALPLLHALPRRQQPCPTLSLNRGPPTRLSACPTVRTHTLLLLLRWLRPPCTALHCTAQCPTQLWHTTHTHTPRSDQPLPSYTSIHPHRRSPSVCLNVLPALRSQGSERSQW